MRGKAETPGIELSTFLPAQTRTLGRIEVGPRSPRPPTTLIVLSQITLKTVENYSTRLEGGVDLGTKRLRSDVGCT